MRHCEPLYRIYRKIRQLLNQQSRMGGFGPIFRFVFVGVDWFNDKP